MLVISIIHILAAVYKACIENWSSSDSKNYSSKLVVNSTDNGYALNPKSNNPKQPRSQKAQQSISPTVPKSKSPNAHESKAFSKVASWVLY